MKKHSQIILLLFLFSQTILPQWIIRNSGTTKNLRDVCFIDPLRISIVGDNGTILRSTNGGANWFFQSSGVSDHLYAVSFTDQNIGTAVGANGRILRTTDGGTTWLSQISGTVNNLNGISCPDSDNCIAVGNSGTILKTIDGGINWLPVLSGTTKHLYDISLSDLYHGSIVGLQTLLSTTNGGLNWMNHNFALSYNLRGVSCLDSNNCTVVGLGGIIIRTSDGNTWSFQTSGTSRNLYSISTSDSVHGNTAGYLGTILGTEDGGSLWAAQTGWTIRNLNGVSFVNKDTGIVVGDYGVIRMTQTGGVPVELTYFIATVNSHYVELAWETATELNNHLFEIQRRNETEEFRTIGYAEGHGTTTEPQNYTYTDKNVERGKYFYRLKQIDFLGTYQYSDEIEVDVVGILEFNLGQNYPNPFNPSTVISYQLPVSGVVTLKVYDILGNEIATLVNEEKQPGNYEAEFDASSGIRNLVSGIYFYQLRAGSFLETKKMVLIK